MIAVVTVILALPLGYLVVSRTAAHLAYAVAYLWAFTFQSVYLLLDTMAGGTESFVPQELPWAYGAVTLGVLLVGVALVEVGRLARRHRRRSPEPAAVGS